ncbi:HelD family protein [Isachenkonia alkalipeptolytica]|uniref:DNA helicase n=1 Tax=Isachenkonia alkalipeptolytica TaxID=2565777 RepID=A0AA44BDR9_9CLOT|nr:UvrD-helicase domain-containing protein [Isachenkonia alkalipeptolytica]NBG88242.1 DNA helicase [Isachenkonia alkalipeptolytica]
MSSKKSPEFKKEEKRLKYTKDYIQKTLEATEIYKSQYKENIQEAMENLDYLDSSQSYISVLINTQFMETAEKNFKQLQRVKDKPYFARIDFIPQEGQKDPVYIGKTSLMRAEDDVPLIVDWRSPIANVYYEGRIGKTEYETAAGEQKGELTLKRQYTMEEGTLVDYMDIDIATKDDFLQASLEAGADDKLKDIASTIQGEQNRIIRADMKNPLIVQGAAGSGKTTIALHRIAYFIYTYEKTFDPDNFMILAPNNIFLDYISGVLPELGVEEVRQTTFIDFMKSLIGNKIKLIGTGEKLKTFLEASKGPNASKAPNASKEYGASNPPNAATAIIASEEAAQNPEDFDLTTGTQNLENLKWLLKFKGSAAYLEALKQYIREMEQDFLQNLDFTLGEHVLVRKETIEELILKDFNHLPLYKRPEELKKTLRNQLKKKKKEVLESIEAYYDDRIQGIRVKVPELEERRQQTLPLIGKRDAELKALEKEAKTLVKDYTAGFVKEDLYALYQDFTTDKIIEQKELWTEKDRDRQQYFKDYHQKTLQNKQLELEDLAPMAYLKKALFGFKEDITIGNVVIDEAQDFSLLEVKVLKELLKTDKFTLLGDLSQGIHSYRSIDNWSELMAEVFVDEKPTYMELTQSYRTTIEIMNLANEVIDFLDDHGVKKAKPVIRHGKAPTYQYYDDEGAMVQDLSEEILSLQREGRESIAVICKDREESLDLKRKLPKNLKTTVLKEDQKTYGSGITIVPSYLAKGLEFDSVIICNQNSYYEDNPIDIKLLYVAITRGMHTLSIFEGNDSRSLLRKIYGKSNTKSISA